MTPVTGSPRSTRDARVARRSVRSVKAQTDARRTRSERIADWVSQAFGSNTFLVANLVWFAVWSLWNTGVLPGLSPFDPFPFGLLTMIVSLEAILLSVFVLIAQNRAERIDELRAEIDLQINMIAEEELTKVLKIVTLIAERQGIDLSNDAELRSMAAPTNIEKLERILEAQINPHKASPPAEPPAPATIEGRSS
jgi:uncharacterized membrane protein